MENNKSLETEIFKVIRTNNGWGNLYLSVSEMNHKLEIMYKEETKMERFIEIDKEKKTIHFYDSPKASDTELECINFVKYMKEEGYNTEGLDYFIEKPNFKQSDDGSIELRLY